MAMSTVGAGKSNLFALVDCNNFFVSCERIFRPDLERKPVVVLSSNDGCVVARSNEAKALGILMGAPAFQLRGLFAARRVVQFSANFDLYGDISRRITSTLAAVTPRTEMYSIDEAFLDLRELAITDYTAWGRAVRAGILRTVGVPVSVGIARSKTLAKLGADYAKQDATLAGVLSFANMDDAARDACLARVPVEDVWGVGRRLAPRLRAEGIHTALGLSQLPPRRARQLMGIAGMQLVHELNGISCHGLTPLAKAPQSIMRSRTFGEDTGELAVLEAAIASFATHAAFQARCGHLLARKALLFLSTSRFKPGYRTWCESVTFPTPTSETGRIITALLQRLHEIHNSGQAYHRAAVTLCDFVPAAALQTNLLDTVQPAAHDADTARMRAVDAINARFGAGRIRYAAESLSQGWRPRRSLCSPRYVSDWAELPEAYPVQ